MRPSAPYNYTNHTKQLLAIWNRAKGKQRDALLWGDEVRWPIFTYLIKRLISLQVEYLVVNYSPTDPNVTLSLRQADILMALAKDEQLCKDGGCVPALQDISHAK
jgi:glutamate--cysteine ligase catalytic subunit